MRSFRAPRAKPWAPEPEAIQYAEAWARLTTRGGHDGGGPDRMFFASAVERERWDEDLDRASIVEQTLQELGNGQSLRWLILHVHHHGQRPETFRALPPGAARAAELMFPTERSMVIAAYRRFMGRLASIIAEIQELEEPTPVTEELDQAATVRLQIFVTPSKTTDAT